MPTFMCFGRGYIYFRRFRRDVTSTCMQLGRFSWSRVCIYRGDMAEVQGAVHWYKAHGTVSLHGYMVRGTIRQPQDAFYSLFLEQKTHIDSRGPHGLLGYSGGLLSS